jgi:hypothetical protein
MVNIHRVPLPLSSYYRLDLRTRSTGERNSLNWMSKVLASERL